MDHFQGQTSHRADLIYGASLSSRPEWFIFKVNRALEKVNPPFYQFSCAIVHGFFGDPEFRPHFCQKYTWTSVKALSMEPVGPHG
ncbi:hypothetical protein KY290_011720 [Solanum tuberosum]|uniref:Uncharacterized protein n=1 Tax=Solanum tuberosum TaxID=4113 RepID=A0ABQ7W3H8_SOLTU|nr:hypothetical protein KY290_011720 [Solanum tuberosum]